MEVRLVRRALGMILLVILAGCSFWRKAPPASPTWPGSTQLPLPSSIPVAGIEGQPFAEQAPAVLPEDRAELDALQGLTRYQIDLEVDAQAHRFQGSAVVQVTNNENLPLEELYFRLLPNGHKSYGNGSLQVSQARVGGQLAEATRSLGDTALQVQLPEALQPGENLSLSLDFNGVIPQDYGGESSGGYGIYNQTQGVIALASWYPILAVYENGAWALEPVSQIGDSVYSETALYSVQVTAPAEMRVAATGVEVDTQTDGSVTRHLFASGPARDFFLIMSSGYQVASLEVGQVRLNAYTLTGQEGAGQAALQVAAVALEAYTQDFGPYPLAELDVVAAPMKYALGVEFPGIVLIASSLYDDPNGQSFSGTIAHEVAHQWWYNLVGNDIYQEPWLDEALATYSTALYYETGVGKGAYGGYLEYLQARFDRLVADGLDNVVTQPLLYFEALNNPRVYGSVAYTKGALFYDALRNQIGDEAFFSALQAYYQTHKYRVATTQDLLEAFRQASDQPLDELYQQWLYSAN